MSDNLNVTRIECFTKLDEVERILVKARGGQGFTIDSDDVARADELMQELIDLIAAVPRDPVEDKRLGYTSELRCMADLSKCNPPPEKDICAVITDGRVMKIVGCNQTDNISEFAFLNIRLSIFAEGIDPGIQLAVEVLRRELSKTLNYLAVS